ncbi:CcmD family protein [Hymenobacter guriensis]|uniref:CcmD family protein n=1 Tax=Hymenobacter guriensis TaxID=2793065 RepID=A0ABS0L2S4_9BACT|nr:CcmD family protein [Hymenobacter guriensis]MBG8554265.1 CcmD family protein [Hymenobacter guriensis]
MKNSLRSFILLVLGLLLPVWHAVAQSAANAPEMADTLRQDGKIYVVVAVIAVVLAGLLVYLISLDRKLTRLEKEVHNR